MDVGECHPGGRLHVGELEDKISRATPGELVAMLYERAVRDLENADALMKVEGDPRSASDSIRLVVHAQQIISELQRSLDKAKGGDLAANLDRILEYAQYRLAEAVAGRKAEPIHDVAGLLSELGDAWRKLVDVKKVRATFRDDDTGLTGEGGKKT